MKFSTSDDYVSNNEAMVNKGIAVVTDVLGDADEESHKVTSDSSDNKSIEKYGEGKGRCRRRTST